MKIGRFDLTKNVLVVAEIGNNHEGKYKLAERLIGLAAAAAADAVKFQTIIPEKLIDHTNQQRLKQLNKFRLSFKEFERLSRFARKERVLFLSTPFDIESARFLKEIVPAFKIASGDNNFYPLIEYICSTAKPIIMSSGLANMAHIKLAKKFIERKWRERGIRQELAILHCVSRYPTPAAEANLLAIRELKKLKVTVGYSDHTLGIDAAVLSVALGARIIEKHFTIDKHYSDFRDHQLSSDPKEFAQLVKGVRGAELLLGNGDISERSGEKDVVQGIRRSIAAAQALKAGATIAPEDLMWVRPGTGFPPGHEKKLIGKVLKRPVQKGEILFSEDV